MLKEHPLSGWRITASVNGPPWMSSGFTLVPAQISGSQGQKQSSGTGSTNWTPPSTAYAEPGFVICLSHCRLSVPPPPRQPHGLKSSLEMKRQLPKCAQCHEQKNNQINGNAGLLHRRLIHWKRENGAQQPNGERPLLSLFQGPG